MNYNASTIANTASSATTALLPRRSSLPSRSRYMWTAGPASAGPLQPSRKQNQYALSPISTSSNLDNTKKPNYNEKTVIPASPAKSNSKALDLEHDASNDESSSFSILSIEFETPPIRTTKPIEEDYDTTSTALFDAENLLADIRHARAEQRSHEMQLVKNIREQLQQATLEQMVGCHDEAEECNVQASRLKQELELVSSAITILDMHILNMECNLEDARMMQAAVVDCSEHQCFAQELKDQLRRLGDAAATSCAN